MNELQAIRSAFTQNASLFTHQVSYRFSQYVAYFSKRVGLTPNAVTSIGFVVSLVAGSLLFVHDKSFLVAAAILLQVGFIFDCADGQLARVTGATSPFGAWYDFVTDRVREYYVYIALAVGLFHKTDNSHYLLLAMIAIAIDSLRHQEVLTKKGIGQTTSEAPVMMRNKFAVQLKYTLLLDIGTRLALVSLLLALGKPEYVFPIFIAWGGLLLLIKIAYAVFKQLHKQQNYANNPRT